MAIGWVLLIEARKDPRPIPGSIMTGIAPSRKRANAQIISPGPGLTKGEFCRQQKYQPGKVPCWPEILFGPFGKTKESKKQDGKSLKLRLAGLGVLWQRSLKREKHQHFPHSFPPQSYQRISCFQRASVPLQ